MRVSICQYTTFIFISKEKYRCIILISIMNEWPSIDEGWTLKSLIENDEK